MVTSGRASPIDWTDETTRQFDLAINGSAVLARVYQRAGFAVAIEGAIDPAAVDRHLVAVGLDAEVVRVSLEPAVDVALRRNRQRATKPFDTAFLDDVIRRIDGDLRSEPLVAGWQRIDNGAESVDETVARILALRRDR
ncbi:MAG: hypothetical protein QOF49_2321 [Chloroflexota bacterium]|jgi:hypothetical protein|nr:hypothetical protein [Chloroflexota bacterium]